MRKKRSQISLTLDVALVKQARALGLNLPLIFERRLREAVREERQRRWLEENREAFEAANRLIEKYGIFNEADREW